LMTSLETIGWYTDEPASQSYPPLFGLFYPASANFLGIVSDFRSRTPPDVQIEDVRRRM